MEEVPVDETPVEEASFEVEITPEEAEGEEGLGELGEGQVNYEPGNCFVRLNEEGVVEHRGAGAGAPSRGQVESALRFLGAEESLPERGRGATGMRVLEQEWRRVPDEDVRRHMSLELSEDDSTLPGEKALWVLQEEAGGDPKAEDRWRSVYEERLAQRMKMSQQQRAREETAEQVMMRMFEESEEERLARLSQREEAKRQAKRGDKGKEQASATPRRRQVAKKTVARNSVQVTGKRGALANTQVVSGRNATGMSITLGAEGRARQEADLLRKQVEERDRRLRQAEKAERAMREEMEALARRVEQVERQGSVGEERAQHVHREWGEREALERMVDRAASVRQQAQRLTTGTNYQMQGFLKEASKELMQLAGAYAMLNTAAELSVEKVQGMLGQFEQLIGWLAQQVAWRSAMQLSSMGDVNVEVMNPAKGRRAVDQLGRDLMEVKGGRGSGQGHGRRKVKGNMRPAGDEEQKMVQVAGQLAEQMRRLEMSMAVGAAQPQVQVPQQQWQQQTHAPQWQAQGPGPQWQEPQWQGPAPQHPQRPVERRGQVQRYPQPGQARHDQTHGGPQHGRQEQAQGARAGGAPARHRQGGGPGFDPTVHCWTCGHVGYVKTYCPVCNRW